MTKSTKLYEKLQGARRINNYMYRRKAKWKRGSRIGSPYQRKDEEKQLWPSPQKEYRVLGSKKTSEIINASLVLKWDTLL